MGFCHPELREDGEAERQSVEIGFRKDVGGLREGERKRKTELDGETEREK